MAEKDSGRLFLQKAAMKTLLASTTIFFTILFFLAFGIACGYAVIAAILRAFGHKPKRSEAAPATAVIAAGR
jgi:hypothetical protein